MYPKVESTFPFSVTHEIVGKLMEGLELVVKEINELAEADPDDPHHFEATITSIQLQSCECCGGKSDMLDSIVFEFTGTLFVKSGTGLVVFSKSVETSSFPVGRVHAGQCLFRYNVSKSVRHMYASEARVYIWRHGTGVKK